MIARKHRFHGHNSVSRVRGKPVHTSFFSVYSAKNKRDNYRMAVVVSKKVAKSAVRRNRIRRRLYECARTQGVLSDTPIDIVFVVKQEQVADIPSEDLAMEFKEASMKAVATL